MDNRQVEQKEYSKMVEELSTCPICLKLAEDAVESECCGFIFCSNCIRKIEKVECPCCRNSNFKYRPALGMRKLIRNMPIKCIYDCGHVDSMENMNKHYFSCKLRDFTCNIHNCSSIFKRDMFLDHLIKDHSEVLINISECFNNLFSSKIQKKLKESDFKTSIKDKNEIIIYNGHSSRLNNLTNVRNAYFDEIIEFNDDN